MPIEESFLNYNVDAVTNALSEYRRSFASYSVIDNIGYDSDDIFTRHEHLTFESSEKSGIYEKINPMYKSVMAQLPSHPNLHKEVIEFFISMEEKINSSNCSGKKRNQDDIVPIKTPNISNHKGVKNTTQWCM